MIEVVSGALISEDGKRCLFGRRQNHQHRPNLWELPGGKVETGETPEAALCREWREELGFAVDVGQIIAHAVFELDHVFAVTLYEVRESYSAWARTDPARGLTDAPMPKLIAHSALRWIEPIDAVIAWPCSPGFYAHYGVLRRYMSRWSP